MFCHASLQQPEEEGLFRARRHNQLTPVFCLPFEVLAEVFGHLQTRTDYSWDEIDRPGYHPSLLWIPEATHVCHRWREVALNTAVLWQDIDVTVSPSWAIEFAHRSKNLPIHISASTSEVLSTEKMRPAIRECVEQLIRASVERIQTIALDDIDDVGGIFSRAASPSNERVIFPILRHLEVATLEDFVLTESSLYAPLLEGLDVRDFCSVDWRAFSLFQNLSSLAISPMFDTWLSDLGAIYRALCQMPNLTELTLYPDDTNLWAEEIVVPPAPCQPVSLPKLRSMHLKTFFPLWLSFILHSIADGPRRALSIEATCDDVQDFEELSSNIPSIMQHVKESSIRSLRIQIIPGYIFLIGSRRFKTDKMWCKGPLNVSIQVSQTFQPPSSYPFGRSVYSLNALLRTVHFQHLQSLTLSLNEPVPAKTWVCLFGHLADLLMVDIQSGLRELCAALVNDIEDSPDQDTIPFRALQSITVEKEKNPYSDKDVSFMRGCLRKRLDLDLPLKELCITFHVKDHELDAGMLKELKEFVVGTTENEA